MPVDQLATAAFVDQTNLGWDAFFRGQLCTSWRKAFLYASPTRDNDTTETHLRWLLKKLHKYSLEVWEFRNGVLHGATNIERRQLQTELLRKKVTAAYDQYAAGKILLFTRGHYIFTKKPLEVRLAGDDDTLLGWLRLLEVAMTAYARQHTAEQLHAARFFEPFRVLGRQKLSRIHLERSSLSGSEDLLLTSNTYNHRQREEEQLSQEVSLPVQSQYLARVTKPVPLSGLSSTVLSDLFDAEHSIAPSRDMSCSLASPGPFYLAPLIDQPLSSDSSYTWSHQRDIALYYDTTTSGSLSAGTPEGYRAEARRKAIERADHLLQYMETMLDSSASSTVTQPSGLPSVSAGSSPSSTSSYATTSDSNDPLWSSATQRLLRFPLDRIADISNSGFDQDASHLSQADPVASDLSYRTPANNTAPSSSEGTAPFALRPPSKQIYIGEFTPEGTLPSPQDAEDATSATSDSSLGTSFLPPEQQGRQVYIEEISMATGVDAPLETEGDEPYYLQLAQDTLETDSGTVTEDQAEEHFDFTTWIADLRGFAPPSTDSEVTLSSSEEYSSATASTTRPVLEILPTPESSARSSSEESGDSEIYIRRSLPLQPPQGELQERDDSDLDLVPSLVNGQDDGTLSSSPSVEELIMRDSSVGGDSQPSRMPGAEAYLPPLIQGVAQGMAFSPVEYISLDAYSPSVEERNTSDSSVTENGQPETAAGAEVELPQLIQGVAQGTSLSPAIYVTMEAYLAALNVVAQAYHETGDPQYLEPYEGEFYESDDANGQSTYGAVPAEQLDLSIQSSSGSSVVSHIGSYTAGYEYYNQDYLDAYYGEENGGGIPADFEGDTIASTAS